MANIPTPVTRREQYLSAIAGEDHGVPESPITREEQYLQAILDNGGGGGGGGTTNYNALSNKPKINNVELTGNKSLADLGITKAEANKLGLVKPDGETTEVDENGVIKVIGGGGDSTITEDITANIEVGGITSGTTIAEGTTLTELAKKMFVKETAPTTTFTASGSGVKEVGTSVTPTLTLTITGKGTGTPVSIAFYDGSTLLDTQTYVDGTNTYTFTMDPVTTTKTVKGVLNYKKSDGTNGTVEKSASYTFVMASYYGAVTTAPTDKAGIIALTKNVKTTKAQTATFNLNNQRSCYCYPASFGNLTSIKDANNFEYLSSYTKTNVTVDDVSYNVYTLTDPVTASGFKQVYA